MFSDDGVGGGGVRAALSSARDVRRATMRNEQPWRDNFTRKAG